MILYYNNLVTGESIDVYYNPYKLSIMIPDYTSENVNGTYIENIDILDFDSVFEYNGNAYRVGDFKSLSIPELGRKVRNGYYFNESSLMYTCLKYYKNIAFLKSVSMFQAKGEYPGLYVIPMSSKRPEVLMVFDYENFDIRKLVESIILRPYGSNNNDVGKESITFNQLYYDIRSGFYTIVELDKFLEENPEFGYTSI